MNLSVPANYDSAIVDQLADYGIREVYGKLTNDAVGGGRSNFTTAGVDEKRLKNYIASLQRRGIEFNYLLNSSCLGNREWDRRWQKKFRKLMDMLGEFGVKRLTVSTPLLFKIIKASYPQFYLKAGIYAQIDTPARARFWEDLGADEITLESFSINRDFKRLSAIRDAVNCSLQLIVNHPCLLNCPMQSYHQNGFAHSSDGSRRIFIDYCFLSCCRMRLEDPVRFVQSAWIRPEDLDIYEQLGFFSFKLLERNIPSFELLKRVRAYSQRRFVGNLAELILPYGFSKSNSQNGFKFWRYFFHPLQIRPGKLKPLFELARMQGMTAPLAGRPIVIDNTRIPANFLHKFLSADCTHTDCDRCGYCRDIASRSVSIDEDFRRNALEKYEQAEELIMTGKLWDV